MLIDLTSGAGKTVTWTSYNYPKSVTANGRTVTFEYGPNRERIREEGGEYTTTFVGAHFESTWDDGGRTDRHYIRVGSQVVAIHVRKPDYHHNTYYLHRDHIGSVSVITDRDGNVLGRMSFDAFGQRRVADTWEEGFPISTELDKIRKVTTRGYTGHQMVDDVNLIHMNGRIYDSELGRFLSPDPNIPHPYNTQSYNRYSYVYNNPLSFTDPSGFIVMRESPDMTEKEMDEAEKEMTEDQREEIERRTSNGDTVTVRVTYSDGTKGTVTYRLSEATGLANSGGETSSSDELNSNPDEGDKPGLPESDGQLDSSSQPPSAGAHGWQLEGTLAGNGSLLTIDAGRY